MNITLQNKNARHQKWQRKQAKREDDKSRGRAYNASHALLRLVELEGGRIPLNPPMRKRISALGISGVEIDVTVGVLERRGRVTLSMVDGMVWITLVPVANGEVK